MVAVENELAFLNWKFILERPTVNRTQNKSFLLHLKLVRFITFV